MKMLKHISMAALIVLTVCLAFCFTVNAAEPATSNFSELKGIEEGVLSSDDFSVAISSRASALGGESDLRIIVVASYDLLNTNQDATLTVALGGKTFTLNIVEDLRVFRSATAAGETYVAAEGSVITGVVITDVPNSAWTDLSVTLSTAAANYVGELTQEKAITHSVGTEIVNGVHYTLNTIEYYTGDAIQGEVSAIMCVTRELINGLDFRSEIDGRAKTLKIYYDGKLYTPTRTRYNNYRRVSLESAGITGISFGKNYKLQFQWYDTDGNLLYYSPYEEWRTKNGVAQNVELPAEGLEKATVNTANIGLDGYKKEYDSRSGLFDGTTNKLCCSLTDALQLTVTFSTAKAETLTYYSFTTGGDTSSYANRNPIGWTLYGKVNGEWVVLSWIPCTGMEALDNTVYSYAVENPQECQDYMIVFDVNAGAKEKTFQLNEIELYTAAQ